MRRLSRALILATGSAGCSSGPSHLPPPWHLPGAAVSSAFGNAAYDARRDRVKALVTLQERALVADIDAGGGRVLEEAMDAARVPAPERPLLLTELRGEPHIYRLAGVPGRLDIEAVTVALMVYGE